MKDETRKMKDEVITVMVDNINDLCKPDSVAGIFSLFDLSSSESKESRATKLSTVHEMFGVDTYYNAKKKW